jgi:hypothetical protein
MPLRLLLLVFAFVLLIVSAFIPVVRGTALMPLALALLVLAWIVT